MANHFFQEQLYDTEEGQLIGWAYFKERELNPEIIKKFQLGYSPQKFNAFSQYALNKGYSKEILEKSGLSIFSERNPEGIDRFRERVIFPIQSFSGRVLGFGGRILKSNEKSAKYLNSPETEIYHKSQVLYGLAQSKQAISKENYCLLVEGYMDVISLHQNGIENVVASSGTALTTEQIKLIKRLTENVTILFDGDAAGIKASFRSIDMLLSEEMNIRVLLFPEGHDPDSFSRSHSMEYVKNFIRDNSKDFIDFKAEILLKDAENDPIKKAEAVRDIVKSVAHVSNGLKQEVYLKQVASQFGLTERNLFDELQNQKQVLSGQNQPKPKIKIVQSIPQEVWDKKINPLLVLEEKLVEYLLKYGNRVLERRNEKNEIYETTVAEEIIHYFSEDDYVIQSVINQKIIDEIKKGFEQNEIRSGNFFFGLLDENISGKVADALVESYEISNWRQYNIFVTKEEDLLEKIVQDVIIRHKREYVMKMMRELKNNLDTANDKVEIYQKIIKLNELKNQIDEKLFRVL